MQTTQLFVEFVLIGLEFSISLGLILSCLIGIEKMKSLISLFQSAPMAVVLIGLLYILGIIFDGFSYSLFSLCMKIRKWCNARKNKNPEKENVEDKKTEKEVSVGIKSKALILKDYQYYLNFTMSQQRLLRATSVNSIFLLFSGIFFIVTQLKNNKIELIIFISIFCLIACVSSVANWKKQHKRFVDNSEIIEKEQKTSNNLEK